jgi:hypothetical protein
MEFYVPTLSEGLPSGLLTPKASFLNWVVQDCVFRFVFRDAFVVVKTLGPLIHATLAVALDAYALNVVVRSRLSRSQFLLRPTSSLWQSHGHGTE